MHNADSFLVSWVIRFLENRDRIRKSIVEIEKNNADFIVHYKDKVQSFTVKTTLDADVFKSIKKEKYFGIVTLNNVENLEVVYANWEKLASFKFLSIYFVNPFSETDKAWILSPYVHNNVCDKGSLKAGLKSMSDMIEHIEEQVFRKRAKLEKS